METFEFTDNVFQTEISNLNYYIVDSVHWRLFKLNVFFKTSHKILVKEY